MNNTENAIMNDFESTYTYVNDVMTYQLVQMMLSIL